MKTKIMIVITILFLNLSITAQTNEFIKSDSIIYPIHKSNIGLIAFVGKSIAIENLKETDFLKSIIFKDKIDLNINVLLGKSLTNYLHELAPNDTAEKLTQNGNYQFTFYIDGKKIYVENLNIGAGTRESKNHKTNFRVPLISTSDEDSWGKFLWNRFYGNGGQEVLTEGSHDLKIEIRPYYKLTKVITGNLIAEGQIKIIVPEIKIDKRLIKVPIIKPLKDWQIATDKIDIKKIEELNEKIAKKNFKNITSIAAIKNSKILIEEYFNGANRNTLHDTRSVGKSFASAILGIAIKNKFIESENLLLKDFYDLKHFENYSASKDSISLKSLLTMSSSFDGSDIDSESAGNEENMYPTKNWVDFTLNLPINKTKKANKVWDYFTAGCIVLGDIINKSVPNGLEKFADKTLFQPLKIVNYKWQYTPQKVPNTAGSLQLRSLDYAKFGQLYKNQGIWNGKQILSREWVAKSLSHQISISDNEFYGYLFWNKTYKIDDKLYEVYYSSGNGGNRIFIFKDYPLVIVITATAYNTPNGEKQIEKMMEQYLIPSILK